MDCYIFKKQVSGNSYADLVNFCCAVSSRMILVVRDPETHPADSLQSILDSLSPFLIKVERLREWPGTILLNDKASVYMFFVSADLPATLIRPRRGLFDWLHPDAPEDPCFIRSGGSPVLVTVSHERDAYLLLTPEEMSCLQARFPALADILIREEDI